MATLTDKQINNAFEEVTGHPARSGDISWVRANGDSTEALAKYIWSHFLNEPEDGPSLEEVLNEVQGVVGTGKATTKPASDKAKSSSSDDSAKLDAISRTDLP